MLLRDPYGSSDVHQVPEYINDNVLDGQFDRQRPNEVWVTDTTEVLYGVDKLKRLECI